MKYTSVTKEVEQLRKWDNDDDFFHVACHVDPQLKAKIKKGEYVELDKLLPKGKAGVGYPLPEEEFPRMELVSQAGYMCHACA